MVTYEQSYFDREGALSLKNNTDTEINNVSFRITYLDINGNALDYEDFSETVDIAPGMTKKIEIPAFGRDKYYSYYESEATLSNPKKFKIKFELMGYNEDQSKVSGNSDPMADILDSYNTAFGLTFLVIILFCIFMFGTYVGLYILVAFMAKRRYRNPALWILVSVFTTPLIAAIILLCIGKSYDAVEGARRNQNEQNRQQRWNNEE